MYIGRWWEVGWLMVWWFDRTFVLGGRQTGAGRGLAGLSLWFDGTSVLGGRQTGAGARFGWVEFVV